MNPNADRIKDELMGDVQGALAGLRSLRDELRLQIHLGGMDARRKLDALEVDFVKLQSAAKHATDGSIVALRDAYLELKASLKAQSGKR
jgi:hypothetical protein